MYVNVNVNEYGFWYRIAFHSNSSSTSSTSSNVTEEKKIKPQKLDINIRVVL